MTERFVLRDEVFGGTLYDRKSLRHSFLKKEEIQEGLHFKGTRVKKYEHWRADTASLPKDILYSPIRVYFEATKICNLRCSHCFNSSGRRGENELTTIEVIKSLEGMRNDHIFDVRFTGGEFTMRPDWFEVLKHAKELGFAVSLNTSCVYKDRSTIDQLASLGLDQITTSIDGSREIHDQMRGKGTYNKTLKTLQKLHERGAVLRTNTVLTGRNTHEMENIIQAVAPYVAEMNFFHMRWTGRAVQMSEGAITYEDLGEFNRRAVEIVKKYPGINIMFGSFVARINSIRMNDLGLKSGGPDGFTRFNLTPDGSLYAGGYAPYINQDLKLGNIKEEGYSTLRVWRCSPKLQEFRDFSSKLVARCLSCPELITHCGGTNIEMELIKLNSPQGRNPYCVIYG